MTIDVNAKSTTDLLNAFETAKAENQAASTAVSNAAGTLFSGWSGVASSAFSSSMGQWLDGLQRVQNALAGLQDNMAAFARSNERTEDDALADASTWIGGGTPMSLPTGSSAPNPPASWT
ncbi:WXG100 family type VII secretion target [Micromonospora sp. WMMD1082]|uniref:WXG100 family type VII secretion target n=1 Tax=Micromonospora sp. WMMD1082 TaxID=3016104 RepID=UPI002416DBD6|nr:WXG100 family type VII secretion target [Micromonospora sp. WMMD1082]MDG4795730.1 WXG100 family type VII secretion target [Micromonospora sp. WMMD1082]